MLCSLVPLQSKGHKPAGLASANAVEWLHTCFGRGTDNLGNAELGAARSLSSRPSVTRSQVVVAHGLQQHMFKNVDDALSALDPRLSVVVLKWVWDETALRLNMTEDALRSLLGDTMADAAESCRRCGWGGLGSKYPCYSV